ncbi:energy-coupling factor ABC transporter ATP-binding protein [Desulfovibrio sp. TomC]|uniref:energy-coupling factor ABC transporter ATP-binding protein n=1 Tax=Desulfovibrio sp. TomC TaxID=1562888 RepID=UPI0005754152|nr:energy-coupling factor ABC transporter ATP-binding protein [Desulfovibrio sp. TomC]KHK03239.1 ABC-type tungstate transport system, ATP-binding protein [Desulfovibrio sp. TomC]
MSALYELDGVVQRYGEREVLRIRDLSIAEGVILGLAGPNGGGKSTLLRLLAFLEFPAEGLIRYQGEPTVGREYVLRGEVTCFPQEPYLLKRSVRANVGYGLSVRGETDVRARVDAALALVGLDPGRFAGRMWHQLSGGEVKRVALAARLALHPRVLLLDEPTANLDRDSAELVRRAVVAAREEHGTTLVISGHDHTWLRAICDDILWLRDGGIAQPILEGGHPRSPQFTDESQCRDSNRSES